MLIPFLDMAYKKTFFRHVNSDLLIWMGYAISSISNWILWPEADGVEHSSTTLVTWVVLSLNGWIGESNWYKWMILVFVVGLNEMLYQGLYQLDPLMPLHPYMENGLTNFAHSWPFELMRPVFLCFFKIACPCIGPCVVLLLGLGPSLTYKKVWEFLLPPV